VVLRLGPGARPGYGPLVANLLAAKKLSTKGQKRATKYFAK
jgi:hypothetical protein